MLKELFKEIRLLLFFLGVFVSLYLIWKLLDLPTQDELVEIARTYFERYGLAMVLASALIEGLLLVGWYYPGGLVIFLGVILAGENAAKVAAIILLVTLGLFLAYLINYCLGRYGWYRLLLAFGLKEPLENAQARLTKYGIGAIFLTCWQPNLAALTSTSAGILHFSFRKFALYSLLATLLGSTFWGTLVYLLGEAALSPAGNQLHTHYHRHLVRLPAMVRQRERSGRYRQIGVHRVAGSEGAGDAQPREGHVVYPGRKTGRRRE